jgi:nitroreductase
VNTIEAIYERRSVKHFDKGHVMAEAVERKLLEGTVQAPTGFNIQHWRFVILRDPELRAKIRNEFVNDHARITDASLLILFTADMQAWRKNPERYWANAPRGVSDLLVNWMAPFHDGRDWRQRYKPYIDDGKNTVTSPQKVYGPETNDLVLQLRKRGIDKVILAGMSANLCTESHMRKLI